MADFFFFKSHLYTSRCTEFHVQCTTTHHECKQLEYQVVEHTATLERSELTGGFVRLWTFPSNWLQNSYRLSVNI